MWMGRHAAIRRLHLTPRMIGRMTKYEELNPVGRRPRSAPCDRKRARYGSVLGARPSVETHESESFRES
eukprot:4509-Prorocentrum_minimum.AAC.1